MLRTPAGRRKSEDRRALPHMGFRSSYLAILRRACHPGQSSCLWPQNRLCFPTSRLPAVLPPHEHQSSTLVSRRWHGGHSDDACHHHSIDEGAKAEGIFRLGLAADVALSVGKAVTGYICGSTAIIADAAHSVSDVVLSSVALLSFRAAKAPKDKEHPYGHGKFESLGALAISIMLLGTAGGIAWHAVDVLQVVLISSPNAINHTLGHHYNHNYGLGDHHHGIDLDHPILALGMTTLSISIKEG
ncbi:Metal tolerance protein C1 [Apostasia shenzhenica]|uniref:Metal tolerance protein C1 n=1 Tax=Apostasia shenzhenica TaxID=1088818 RepID=A0A2I0ASC8_9ASPA|nr:Metal tolerance protein C1 [Apostasia shenzhenica]